MLLRQFLYGEKDSKALLYAHDIGIFPVGLTGNDIVRKRIADMGLTHENMVCVVDHFSHNGFAGHDEPVHIEGARGYEVSYDGMIVEF